jgi:hypothetical protein
MTELLLESPITVGVAGGLATAVALFVWIQGGFRAALISAGVLAVLTVILVLVSLQVETDREKLRRTIHEVAGHLQNNRFEAIYGYIHPNAKPIDAQARAELPKYRFQEARVTNIKQLEVNPRTKPKSATAEFFVAVSVDVQGQSFPGIRRFVRVYFFEKDGRWLVNHYEHFEPTAGFRNSTSP